MKTWDDLTDLEQSAVYIAYHAMNGIITSREMRKNTARGLIREGILEDCGEHTEYMEIQPYTQIERIPIRTYQVYGLTDEGHDLYRAAGSPEPYIE